MLAQVASNMTGPAGHIARWANIAHARSKTIEELPVKWLVLQLIEDVSDVFVHNPVITGLNIHVP